MPQYTVGLVTATSGSTTLNFDEDVNGNAPALLSNVEQGDKIRIDTDNIYYTIAEVVSNTQLTLQQPYYTNKTDVSFEIIRDFTENRNYPLPNQGDLHFADLMREVIRMIDADAQFGLVWKYVVEDVTLTEPPLTPNEGDKYIVASGATGDWENQDNMIATYDGAEWEFESPSTSWYVYNVNDSKIYFFDGSLWRELIFTFEAGAPASGDVVGPEGATANTIAVFSDTTGKVIEDTSIEVDGDNLNVAGEITASNFIGPIGATSPSSGAFTSLNVSVDGTIGTNSSNTLTVNSTTTFINATGSGSGIRIGNAAQTKLYMGSGNTFVIEASSGGIRTGDTNVTGKLRFHGTDTDNWIEYYGTNAIGFTLGNTLRLIFDTTGVTPATNNGASVGSSLLRLLKIWATDGDFSGNLGVSGTLQSNGGLDVYGGAVFSDEGFNTGSGGYGVNGVEIISADRFFKPTINDPINAPINSIFINEFTGKLCFKDSSGTPQDLY